MQYTSVIIGGPTGRQRDAESRTKPKVMLGALHTALTAAGSDLHKVVAK